MAERDEAARQLHREFGASCFNAAWELIDKPDRSASDDAEMLLAAAASRWHWGQAGAVEQAATGDWQVSHVAALLGLGDLAHRFARRALAVTQQQGWDGWRLGSAHEGMARACAACGDRDGRDRHVALATAALEKEPDEEDRQIIAAQLATIE